MIIIFRAGATDEQISSVLKRVRSSGSEAVVTKGDSQTILGVVGDPQRATSLSLAAMPGVEGVHAVTKPYRLVARKGGSSISVPVGDVRFGADTFTLIAGPCSVESEDQTLEAARAAKKAGAGLLRGGAYKPRTSPYSFQGLAEEGLRILELARLETGLPIVTEVIDSSDVETVASVADMLQIGARSMQNFRLLRAAGKTGKPILLKRAMNATIEEWLMAAEYIASEGNEQIVLCERGIRTFETATRNTLDISAVPVVKQESHLPVIVDPSHASGRKSLVAPLARAAVAAGADGVMVDVHARPEEALVDGAQALLPDDLYALSEDLRMLAESLGKQTQSV